MGLQSSQNFPLKIHHSFGKCRFNVFVAYLGDFFKLSSYAATFLSTRAANSSLNLNSKKLSDFAELEV